MRSLSDSNPIAVFIYTVTVTGISMFCMNPVILALSLAGSVCFFAASNRSESLKSHLPFLALFLASALLNPLFHHNGVTVLFMMNDNPVTLEAALYGAASGAMLVSALYWFRSFSRIMTSDKLLYLLGSAAPKLSLVFSMALRSIPLFKKQIVKINRAQKALGLYRDDNIIDDFRGGARVFSAASGWALENGITTADSMAARGYGTGRRTRFSIFRFGAPDVLLTALSLGLGALTACAAGAGALAFEYYPAVSPPQPSPLAAAGCAAYGLLSFLPALTEIKEIVKWKFLKSKI